MTTWQTGYVHAGTVTLHYQRAGRGQTVIMLHGMTDSGDCWKAFADQLVTTYDVILVDARGHGMSSKNCETVAHVDQVADLRMLLTHLQLHKPFVIGHSMGAMVAFIAACTYPELLRAVVLEDPRFRPIIYNTPALQAEARANVWRWIASMQAISFADLLHRCIAENPTWRANELVAWVQSKHAVGAQLQWEDARNMVPWQQRMPLLGVPALLITADVSKGGLVDADAAAEARTLSALVEIAHIHNVGHSIRREAPDAYAAIVEDYLRRH